MGKILKYCNSCEEGFAERFAFCPDCGSPLQAYEINPVGKDAAPVAEQTVEEQQAPETPEVMEAAPASFIDEPEVETAPIAESAPEVIADSSVDTPYEELEAAPITGPLDAEDEVFDEAPEEVVEEPAPVYAASDSFYETPAMHADEPRATYVKDYSASNRDDGFYVTVIQEKNGKQRNALLLGSTIFMLTAVMVAWGVSLFQKELGVGSIGDERSLAMLIDEVPMPVEEVEPENKNDDEGGGGGGGGKEEPEPVSQGDLAPQMRNPPRPPDARFIGWIILNYSCRRRQPKVRSSSSKGTDVGEIRTLFPEHFLMAPERAAEWVQAPEPDRAAAAEQVRAAGQDRATEAVPEPELVPVQARAVVHLRRNPLRLR
jgi:hypothetical protein